MSTTPVRLALLVLLPCLAAAAAARAAPETIIAPPPGGYALDRLTTGDGQPGVLKAGAAAVEITPHNPRGMFLAGFGPNREARGVRDPIYARALVISDGRIAVAIVVLDLVGTVGGTSERIAALSSAQHPERVLVTATHNHHAPDPLGYWGPTVLRVPVRSGVDQRWLRYVERRAALAVHRAAQAARPARVSVARADAPGGICRCLHRAEQSPGPLTSIVIDDAEGQPIATWMHYACHPETLWDRNQLISADWAGEVYQALERVRGGTALVTVGSLGGVAPEPVFDGSLRDRYWQKRQSGRALAETAFRAGAESGRSVVTDRLRLYRSEVELPVENWQFELAINSGLFSETLLQGKLEADIALLELGGLRIGFVPGEFTPEAGAAVEQRIAGEPTMLVNLFDVEIGYVVTPEQFADADNEYLQYLKAVSLGPGTYDTLFEGVGALAAQAAAAENVPGSEDDVEPPVPEHPRLGPPERFDEQPEEPAEEEAEEAPPAPEESTTP